MLDCILSLYLNISFIRMKLILYFPLSPQLNVLRLTVISYNTALKFRKRHSLRSVNFVFSVLIPEQTAIISLYRINLLVFMVETECVYCAVRTGSEI